MAILFFLFSISSSYSQNNNSQKEYYKWFDAVVGDGNIDLYDGLSYKEIYRTIDGDHKYYQSPEFMIGNLSYNGQPYYDIEMKYDIYDDELIVKLPSQSGFSVIQLINQKIDEFFLNDKLFVRITSNGKTGENKNNLGFYEVSFQSKQLTLYKKHKKSRKERLGKKFVYSIFKDESEHLLYYNNVYVKLQSKKSVMALFPELKKEINDFYKRNKVLQRTNFDAFMTQQMKQISSLLTNNTL